MSARAEPIQDARTLRLELRPQGSLFCGGYSAAQGASGGETASDRRGLLIPASAVKGAIRESALRLVHAAGTGTRLLVSLFGDEFSESEGKLCFGVLRPPSDIGRALSTRHHVSLSRATRSAVAGHLFDQRVVAAGLGLTFSGQIDLRESLNEDEWRLLRLAADMTDRIGAGRGRGLGQIEIQLEPSTEPVSKPTLEMEAPLELVEAPPNQVHDVVFEIEIVEPMKLGRVKDRSNVEATDEVMHGSMFRGAVAGGLLRLLKASESRSVTQSQPVSESHAVMDLVFAEPEAVIFGDGHPVLAPTDSAIDIVPAPLTLKESKAGGSTVDEAVELARAHLADSASAKKSRVGLRSAKGSWGRLDGGWRRVKVPRRLLTRLARDPASGRASDGRLYSLDVIDPGDPSFGEESSAGSLRYQIPIRGTTEQIDWVRRAFEGGVRVGGTRSRGLGRVELRRVLPCNRTPVADRHRAWIEALEMASVTPEAAAATGVLLALGPVVMPQPLLLDALNKHGLQLVGGRSKRRLIGGWNSKAKLPRRTGSAFIAGSSWLVEKRDGSSALPALEALEKSGLGPGRADGWGRLVACHGMHLELNDSSEGARNE